MPCAWTTMISVQSSTARGDIPMTPWSSAMYIRSNTPYISSTIPCRDLNSDRPRRTIVKHIKLMLSTSTSQLPGPVPLAGPKFILIARLEFNNWTTFALENWKSIKNITLLCLIRNGTKNFKTYSSSINYFHCLIFQRDWKPLRLRNTALDHWATIAGFLLVSCLINLLNWHSDKRMWNLMQKQFDILS